MSLLSLNLSEVEVNGKFEFLPVGLHTLTCVSAKHIVDSVNNKAKIKAMFKRADAAEDDKEVVFVNFNLVADFLWVLKSFLMAAGEEELANSSELNTEDLVGLIATGDVQSNVWTNKDGEVVDSVQVKRWIINE